jgi:hypothetical protein
MSDNLLRVGSLAVGPGEKLFGYEEVGIAGTTLKFGVFLINGSQPGPTLLLSPSS